VFYLASMRDGRIDFGDGRLLPSDEAVLETEAR
jgi:hypothetical protein